MPVRTNVKAGGTSLNHNQPVLRVKTGVRLADSPRTTTRSWFGTMPTIGPKQGEGQRERARTAHLHAGPHFLIS